MAGLESEVFLEIGACTNSETGAWGKVFYGAQNGSKFDTAPTSSHQPKTSTLFRVKNYNHSVSRKGSGMGSMQSIGDAAIGLVTLELDATDIDIDEMIQAFGAWEEGDGVDTNIVNFHVHCFREYHPNPSKPQEKHHWWTLSGWVGHIVSLNESAGEDGDQLQLVLSAEHWRFTDWDGPDGEGKMPIDKSISGDSTTQFPMT